MQNCMVQKYTTMIKQIEESILHKTYQAQYLVTDTASMKEIEL